MKKLLVAIVSLICLNSICCDADNTPKVEMYRVLAMNNGDILINGKKVRVGMVFDDKAKVTWSKEKQAMRVFNMRTKRQFLMVSYSLKQNNLTAYEILTSNRHLSTHESENKKTSFFSNLKLLFEDQYSLMDSIMISTDMPFDDNHYLLATYKYGDAQISKKLDYKDGHIIIDRTLFNIEDEHLEPRDIFITIEYKDEERGMMAFVKSDIELLIIPDKLQ